MKSFPTKALQSMYAKSVKGSDTAAKILNILRERLESAPEGKRKLAEGLVLELRDVREHERDGVSVVEHIKGFWVRESI